MLKKLLTGAAAIAFAATVAGAANLTIFSGPQDPSQLLATVNTLIQNINFGTAGRLNTQTVATGTSTTVEQTLLTYSLPANRIASDGDGVRVVCWGTSATNANLKVGKLYFGNSVVATNTQSALNGTAINNKAWMLRLTVLRSGAATQKVMGESAVDPSPNGLYTNAGTDSFASAIVIKCTGTTATASQDLTAQGMYVEQLK